MESGSKRLVEDLLGAIQRPSRLRNIDRRARSQPVAELRALRRQRPKGEEEEGAALMAAVHEIIRTKPTFKENPRQMIERKRQMLLMQLRIDQKRERVKFFEERVMEKNDKLKEVETGIYRDLQAFERFQQESVKTLKNVISQTEQERRERVVVMQELKSAAEAEAGKASENKRLMEKFRELYGFRIFLQRLMLDKKPLVADSLAGMLEDTEIADLRAKVENADVLVALFRQIEESNLQLMRQNQANEILADEREAQLLASQNRFAQEKEALEEQMRALTLRIAEQTALLSNLWARDFKEVDATIAFLLAALAKACASSGLPLAEGPESALLMLQDTIRAQLEGLASRDSRDLRAVWHFIAEENKKKSSSDALMAEEVKREHRLRRLNNPSRARIPLRPDVFRSFAAGRQALKQGSQNLPGAAQTVDSYFIE